MVTFITLVTIPSTIFAYSCIHEMIDIKAVKRMNLVYSGESKNIDDGLIRLAGKNGLVKWSSSEIINSYNQHITSVTAIVSGNESNGNAFTAKFNFSNNHDKGTIYLEEYELNDRTMNIKAGSISIVTGHLSYI